MASTGVNMVQQKKNQQFYQYQVLPSTTSFRILELLPGTKESDIQINLRVADWRNSPIYDAISYAWGDPNDCAIIYCNDSLLKVTQNLYSSLKQLRFEHESRFLWADSISINQTDFSEKGSQVSGMRNVYQRAQSVIIWLGNDDAGLAEAAKSANISLARGCCRAKGLNVDDLWRHANFYPITLDISARTLEIDMKGWCALEWLFKRSWFGRLWVFQEAICGRKLEVICGNTIMDWDIVGFGANYLCIMGFAAYEAGILQYRITSTHAASAANMRNADIHTHHSALRVLHSGREFLATQPVDHVFGMLAFPAIADLHLEVDYRKSTAEIFTEAARACIRATDSLEILAYVQHTNGIPDVVPSWVPMWDQKPFGLIVGFDEAGMWAAGGEVPADIDIVPSLGLLRVRGIVFDVVKEILVTNIDWPNLDQPLTSSPLLFSLWKEQQQRQSHSPEAWAAAFLVHHRPTVSEPDWYTDPNSRARLFATYLRRCAICMEDTTWEETELRQYPEYLTWQEFESPGMNTCYGRAIFTTNTGYLGRGSTFIKEGDIVCVLFGGSVPYVLRSDGERYCFLGEAYIYGVMLGEAIDQWKAGSFKEEMFEIL